MEIFFFCGQDLFFYGEDRAATCIFVDLTLGPTFGFSTHQTYWDMLSDMSVDGIYARSPSTLGMTIS